MPIVETELFPKSSIPGTQLPVMNAPVPVVGTSPKWAHEDHIHPTDASLASSNNPTFTGTATFSGPAVFNGTATFNGTPTAPTAAALNNSTQVATTAYTDSAVGVEKTRAQGAEALLAPIASPTFTGTPAAPTPAVGDNSTKLATTAFAQANAVLYSLVQALTAVQQIQARQNIYSAPFDAMMQNNIIINGGMEVSQENGGTLLTLVNAAAPKYITDMWSASYTNTGAVMKAEQAAITPVSGVQTGSALLMQSTTAISSVAAGDFMQLLQPLEGLRFAHAQFGTATSQPVTIGFWVNATVTGTFSVGLHNGAFNRSYVTNVVYTNAATWQYVTVTIPGDTTGTWPKDNTLAGYLFFCFAAGSTYQTTANAWQAGGFLSTSSNTNLFSTNGNNVYITGVTMHLGTEGPSQARSGFALRPFQEELMLCQRYWWSTGGYSSPKGGAVGGFTMASLNTTTLYASSLTYPVMMRIKPTTTLWNNGVANQVRLTTSGVTSNAGPISTAYGNESRLGPVLVVTTLTAGNWYDFDILADARM